MNTNVTVKISVAPHSLHPSPWQGEGEGGVVIFMIRGGWYSHGRLKKRLED